MILRAVFLIIFSLQASLFGDYNQFNDNPLIPEDFKDVMKEFLLPESHPIKPYVDMLFENRVVMRNKENFENAGFQILYSQARSKIIVARHKWLPGYLVKVVLDNELELKRDLHEWFWFTQRCIGAKLIRDSIQSHGFKHFSVPHKWIYPLPWQNAPGAGYLAKAVILIVDDMHLMDHADSHTAWKVKITKEHLDELFIILKEAGGASYRTDNIPYSFNGTFAFIDTEYPGVMVNLARIKKLLSTEMAGYWQALIDSDGRVIQEGTHTPQSENPINPLYFCLETIPSTGSRLD